ncbi:thiamine phosphate synthase [Tessaracoccus sp. MC1679]|uniref:thiamine phosphate synthase n=1 Tax=Tessaracoccus sp. MC1679 TaxID=2760313 RepID=UPI0015FF9FE5|nr:thiamine phosphate synthase [Tessaracoccus sp. MC1679]MBB1514712.1 thiamine phosphate synthase [Tessaracoccus sp. MC1679]
MTQATPGLADGVDWRVYYVTDTAMSGGPAHVPGIVEQAILGGAGVVQIRDKDLHGTEFLALARACVDARDRAFDATGRTTALVVNDRLHVAEELGLHFHQGQDDGAISQARARLGRDLLIGLSISTEAELDAELSDLTADVLGLSPLWATPTKTDAAPALGLDGAARLVLRTAGRAKTVAIGGINATNAAVAIATGVDGICVVSALTTAPDPRAAADELLALWRTR